MNRLIIKTWAFGGILGGIYGFTDGWRKHVETPLYDRDISKDYPLSLKETFQCERKDYSPVKEIAFSTAKYALLGSTAPISIPISSVALGILVSSNIISEIADKLGI